jgi:hypothetical protein
LAAQQIINKLLSAPQSTRHHANDIALGGCVGRALGSLIGRWCPGASPSGALGPTGDLGGPAAQDRSIEFGRPPAFATYLTPRRSGSLFEATRRAPWPLRAPWAAWASHRARLEAPRHPSHSLAATDLPCAAICPRGPKGEGGAALVNHSSARSSRLEVPFGPTFRLKGSDRQATQASALLSVRCNRPSRRCAAEKRDEVAPIHYSTTSSAAYCKVSGMVRPSALAVVRFIASSNLLGSIVGSSAGFSPRRIRPAYTPTWRKASGMLVP